MAFSNVSHISWCQWAKLIPVSITSALIEASKEPGMETPSGFSPELTQMHHRSEHALSVDYHFNPLLNAPGPALSLSLIHRKDGTDRVGKHPAKGRMGYCSRSVATQLQF